MRNIFLERVGIGDLSMRVVVGRAAQGEGG